MNSQRPAVHKGPSLRDGLPIASELCVWTLPEATLRGTQWLSPRLPVLTPSLGCEMCKPSLVERELLDQRFLLFASNPHHPMRKKTESLEGEKMRCSSQSRREKRNKEYLLARSPLV